MNNYSEEAHKDEQDEVDSESDAIPEEDNIPEPMVRRHTSQSSIVVLMKAQTWERESHGLYDYESRRVKKFETKLESNGFIARTGDEVSFEKSKALVGQEEHTLLLNLKKKVEKDEESEKFYISPINDNQPNDRLWLVIRSLKQGYKIKKHDILKLGRMKFKVKEFRTENEYFEGEHKEKSPHKGFEETKDVEKCDEENMMCRFCWIGDKTEENPLI